jgi:hypothetical protein
LVHSPRPTTKIFFGDLNLDLLVLAYILFVQKDFGRLNELHLLKNILGDRIIIVAGMEDIRLNLEIIPFQLFVLVWSPEVRRNSRKETQVD